MRPLIGVFCAFASLPLQAAVCNPAAFQGAYGFQLSGTTTISGAPQPAAAVGRLVLDGSGGISGVSSVKFTGLLLGNPVTGMYEAKADCSVSWSLQDDSGNSQHFEGTMTQDGARITFHQSDAGGARDGVMQRSPTSCSAGDFRGRYSLSVSGSSIDVDTNKITGTLSQSGQIEADGQGNVSFIASPSSAAQHAGTFEIGDDCFVQLALQLSTGNDTVQWKFRAVVVNGGRELIGIESDPGTVATLRLTSK